MRELWPFGPLSTMAVGDDSYDYCYVRLTLEFDSYEKGNLLLGLSDILVSRPYSWKPPGPYGPDYIVVPLELYSVACLDETGVVGRDGTPARGFLKTGMRGVIAESTSSQGLYLRSGDLPYSVELVN